MTGRAVVEKLLHPEWFHEWCGLWDSAGKYHDKFDCAYCERYYGNEPKRDFEHCPGRLIPATKWAKKDWKSKMHYPGGVA